VRVLAGAPRTSPTCSASRSLSRTADKGGEAHGRDGRRRAAGRSESSRQSYESRVRQALEAGGDTQPRQAHPELLAHDIRREWSSADVIPLIAEQIEKRDDWSSLHSALAALTGAKHGTMLRRTGTAGTYLCKFNDPDMRPYLRLATFPREQGELPAPESQSA